MIIDAAILALDLSIKSIEIEFYAKQVLKIAHSLLEHRHQEMGSLVLLLVFTKVVDAADYFLLILCCQRREFESREFEGSFENLSFRPVESKNGIISHRFIIKCQSVLTPCSHNISAFKSLFLLNPRSSLLIIALPLIKLI